MNKPPKPSKRGDKAARERRARLSKAVGISPLDLRYATDAVLKLRETAAEFEEMDLDDLALSVSGLVDQAKERQQQLAIQTADEFTQLLGRETATLGVLLIGKGERWMAELGGFFVRNVEDLEDGLAQLDVILVGANGEMGQSPENYEPSGPYLRS